MAATINYKGLVTLTSPGPSGDGGIMLQNNFSGLALSILGLSGWVNSQDSIVSGYSQAYTNTTNALLNNVSGYFYTASNNATNQNPYNWYISSFLGSSSGNGKTPQTAFAKLAQLSGVISSGQSVGLQYNSHFHETLDFTILGNIDYITIGTYGQLGVKPLIDCSDVISGIWIKTIGQTNTYEQEIIYEYSVGEVFVRVWENNVSLPRQTSLSGCDFIAGSYYMDTESAVSGLLRIHPTLGGNPNISGAMYEYNKRGTAYVDAGPNTYVENIWTRRNLSNAGSVELNGEMNNCFIQDGTFHNIRLIGNRPHLFNTKVIGAYCPPAFLTTGDIVNYNVDNADWTYNVVVDGCHIEGNTFNDPTVGGFLGHTNVGGSYGSIVVKNTSFKNLLYGATTSNTSVTNYENCNVENTSTGLSANAHCYFINCYISAYIPIIFPGTPCNYVIKGCTLIVTNPSFTGIGCIVGGSTKLTCDDNIFVDTVGPVLSAVSTQIRMNNNVYNTAYYYWSIGAANIISSDNNAFLGPNNASTNAMNINGSGLSLADYKTLIGKDANSD